MKILLSLLVMTFSFHCYAKDLTTAGLGSNGKTFAGTVAKSEDDKVSGELVDEDGKTHDFKGKIEENGEISGKTKDGISVELTSE